MTERGERQALHQTSEDEPALRTAPTPCDGRRRQALLSGIVEVVSHSLALGLSRFDFRQLAFPPGSLNVLAVLPCAR